MGKKSDSYFHVTFRDPKDGQVISLKVLRVQDSTLGLSFVCLSDFIFETKSLLANPAEEQLRHRFEGVRSLHLSLYSILSIEERGDKKAPQLKFSQDHSNLVVLPNNSNQPHN
jgi:hypothetical protein